MNLQFDDRCKHSYMVFESRNTFAIFLLIYNIVK